MQRFKHGDSILVLPKFSHLFPEMHGIVVAVRPDPFRPVFTEYTVLFRDGSKADLFEFQLIEDVAGCRLLIADTTFVSSPQQPQPGSRGSVSDQHVILRAGTIDIDIKIHRSQADS